MKRSKLLKIVLIGIVIFLFILIYLNNSNFSSQTSVFEDFNGNPKLGKSDLPQHNLIAHAGGEIDGMSYTNSLEALNYNYKQGFRYFELDFEWTSDEKIVVIHDWENSVKSLFGLEPIKHSFKEFKNATMINNLTQLTLEDLVYWVRTHPDSFIITDVKTKNLEMLEYIVLNYPEIAKNIIPQVYSFEEFRSAKLIGYPNIILTLYRQWYEDYEILNFVQKNKVLGITMHFERGFTELPLKLKQSQVYTMVHTVNDENLMYDLQNNAIRGFYTDSLTPKDFTIS